MLKQIEVGRKLFGRTPVQEVRTRGFGVKVFLIAVALVVNLSLALSLIPTPQVTAAAANNTVNFQGRLQRNSGVSVDASDYNIQFKLYDAKSGGAALWSEDYLVSANTGVSVDTNGYFSVKLGSVTPFSSNIDWSKQLWITMNIGGIEQTADWDGEMNPRLQLTAVPYAFQAGGLTTQKNGNTSTLSWADQTASNTLLLPNKSGTLCVSGDSEGCGFVAGDNNSYIQNTSSPQANTNFNVSGNGTVGGSLTLSGQNPALVGSSNGLSLNAPAGDITLSSNNGSVVAKAGSDDSTKPTFVVQNANAINLLAAYTGVGLVKIGIGQPTVTSSGQGDLYVSGSGEFAISLRVGSAQDGLNFVAGAAPSATNALFNGNSRPVKTIAQLPEFNGMTTTHNAKGSLTTDIDTSNNSLRNYYNWTTSQSNAQTENMYVQIPVPRDFSALTKDDQICFNVYTDDISGDSGIAATFYDTANKAQDKADISPSKANEWQRKCTKNIGGTITVDGTTYVTIQITLKAATDKNVRISGFSFDYLAAF